MKCDFFFSIKGRKNELQTKSEQCYIKHGEVKLETGFMKQNLKYFFTFVEGDTRSSWYRYSDGPPPILAMRNFSEKQRKEISFQHWFFKFICDS